MSAMAPRHRGGQLAATASACMGLMLLCPPPAAAAAMSGGRVTPLAFLGLPSLHSIIEGIAKGFFSALAGVLVPGFLKHGTVATIQHLVALPDPGSWGHVSELQSDMTYLGMSLMPVTLTVCTLRYWMLGLTGAAHPVTAIGRCTWATGVLVAYRWLVEQTVAATNTLTHAILGFPVVANGLASIITVLFGGALLVGAGGVFGAFLVIVGVVFAAALFASAEALTVVLALVFCAGPPLIALSPIPELSHLARVWGHALMAIVFVPIGWTILFATAGALTLDATSVTHGAGGLPAHVAAAFAGLITFILAVRLPLILFGQLRHLLSGGLRAGSNAGEGGSSGIPGAERVRAAHERLRSFAVEGMPAVGRTAGRAAGAMGAPQGGPLGATRRSLQGVARRAGLTTDLTPAAASAAAAGRMGGTAGRSTGRGGVRERVSQARAILASAPQEAKAVMAAGVNRTTGAPAQRRAKASASKTRPRSSGATDARSAPEKKSNATGSPVKEVSVSEATARQAPRMPPSRTPQTAGQPGPVKGEQSTAHPGRKVTTDARREASSKPLSAPGPFQPPPRKPAAAKKRRAASRRPRRKGRG